MAKAYLYAIQDAQGRELVSWQGEVDRVGDVTADLDVTSPESSEWEVLLNHNGVELGRAYISRAIVDEGMTLYRWPADDKLATPVAHKITENYEES